jgi:hypothetical protein
MLLMDDQVIAYGVQVRETGRKSFTLDCMSKGRPASSCPPCRNCAAARLLPASQWDWIAPIGPLGCDGLAGSRHIPG